jgi:hypothetical protein
MSSTRASSCPQGKLKQDCRLTLCPVNGKRIHNIAVNSAGHIDFKSVIRLCHARTRVV